ncbi:ECF subfamily RNA polymerase sigma-24 subunit [Actinoplanes sp. SE50]|nr:RNA polymerase, sigma-24 subunit, ECF subfamily [Actinoplanes sp. SE50/110]ATO83164.1 ECF subfamily RNA polymerase sigma-24 subunit [Actinoplanes sp. SE50]SLM00571.1 hypothetical protein ACSP50_3804 [Actinoplanes sp. SE50/110]
MRHVRRHWRLRRAAPPRTAVTDAELTADPGADFVDLTITALHLSGQRREVAEATRWREPDDRELLSLWWLEAAGQLTGPELAAALSLTPAQAAVRVQRMKAQLERARSVVRAVSAVPLCPLLSGATRDWGGRPAGLWGKRIARHLRECATCDRALADVIPAERLLAGLPLLLPPRVFPPLRGPRHTARRWLPGVSGAAVVLVGAVAGVVLTRSPERTPVPQARTAPAATAAATTTAATTTAPASRPHRCRRRHRAGLRRSSRRNQRPVSRPGRVLLSLVRRELHRGRHTLPLVGRPAFGRRPSHRHPPDRRHEVRGAASRHHLVVGGLMLVTGQPTTRSEPRRTGGSTISGR